MSTTERITYDHNGTYVGWIKILHRERVYDNGGTDPILARSLLASEGYRDSDGKRRYGISVELYRSLREWPPQHVGSETAGLALDEHEALALRDKLNEFLAAAEEGGMDLYATTFLKAGWTQLVDVPVELANELAALLHEKGTSFASTSEPAEGQRRFYLSDNSVPHAEEFLRVRAA